MTVELPDRQRTPVSARVLNTWLRDAQTQTGVGEKRIGWLLASTVAVAALQRAIGTDRQPLFLLKGGLLMEFHLGLDARTTKDVDALFRGGVADFERALDSAIADPWGPFVLQRTVIEEISGARRLVKPRRFDLKLLIKGAVWRRIKVEISFPEGRIADGAEPVPAPHVGFFGITTPDHLAGIAMAYQVAQKLHACTDPDEPPAFVNVKASVGGNDAVQFVPTPAIWWPAPTSCRPNRSPPPVSARTTGQVEATPPVPHNWGCPAMDLARKPVRAFVAALRVPIHRFREFS